jgi:hypothetical protein
MQRQHHGPQKYAVQVVHLKTPPLFRETGKS